MAPLKQDQVPSIHHLPAGRGWDEQVSRRLAKHEIPKGTVATEISDRKHQMPKGGWMSD